MGAEPPPHIARPQALSVTKPAIRETQGGPDQPTQPPNSPQTCPWGPGLSLKMGKGVVAKGQDYSSSSTRNSPAFPTLEKMEILGHPHSTDWESEAQKACTELSACLVPESVLWAISACSASWGQEEEAKGAPAVVGKGHLGT